jgi:hypothetical protein
MNLIHTVKQGTVGKPIEFTLSEADGLVDLDPFVITMTLAQDGVVVLDDVAVTKKDQTVYPGQCFHTWTQVTGNIDPGEYDGELKLVNGPNVYYWPTNKVGQQTYFTVIVQAPLG